jgi:hypothetical protein
MSEKCNWKNIRGNWDEPCDEPSTLTLPGEWYFYPWESDEVPLCAKHHAMALALECDT